MALVMFAIFIDCKFRQFSRRLTIFPKFPRDLATQSRLTAKTYPVPGET